MGFQSVLSMFMLFVVIPVWIGMIWVRFLRIKDGAEVFFMAWITGIVTMLAVGQIVLVPMIAAESTLSLAVSVIKMLYTVFAVISFYIVLGRFFTPSVKSDIENARGTIVTDIAGEDADEKRGAVKENAGKKSIFTAVFGVAAALLIFLQAFVPAYYQHIDDDDSRFVSEEVSAVVHDTMLKDDPISDRFMYWDMGETRKDLASPWTMYVAACCRIVNLAPAVFSHTLFPFFMIPICYAVFFMIGCILFRDDREKVFLFLIFLSVLLIWDYTSTHTIGSMLLLRIWQGKALAASFIIPVLLLLFYRILQQKESVREMALLPVVSFAGSLVSGIGIVIVSILLAIYGLVDFIYYRNGKKTLAIWMSAAPCGVYLVYYLSGIV